MECAERGRRGACDTMAGTQGGVMVRSEVLGTQEAYTDFEQPQWQWLQTLLGDSLTAQFQGEDAQQDGQLGNKLASLICVQVTRRKKS